MQLVKYQMSYSRILRSKPKPNTMVHRLVCTIVPTYFVINIFKSSCSNILIILTLLYLIQTFLWSLIGTNMCPFCICLWVYDHPHVGFVTKLQTTHYSNCRYIGNISLLFCCDMWSGLSLEYLLRKLSITFIIFQCVHPNWSQYAINLTHMSLKKSQLKRSLILKS